MSEFQELKVTYGSLERALLTLGYALSLHETHRLYQHEASGSIYTLSPDVSMRQQVCSAHLLSLRHAVVRMGVADEERLRTLLTVSEVADADRGRPFKAAPKRRNAPTKLPAPAASSAEAV